jgi:pyruvate/2-oxoglutarate dehydrogenase complex dihydrolipoamide dehydrogenase (E3) component
MSILLTAWRRGTTAVVERKWIGGSCPNIACMPSKNEISSARVAHLVRHAAEYGWTLEPGAIDMAVVRKRKRDMVAAQVAKHLENYKRRFATSLGVSVEARAPNRPVT